MNLQDEKITKLSVENFYIHSDASMIKDFIISNKNLKNLKFTFAHPHVFDGIAFAIWIKGKGRFKINLTEYNVEPNTVITFLPNNIIEFLEQSEDTLIEYLIFSFDFISDLKQLNYFSIKQIIDENPCLKLNEDECENLLGFHSLIVNEYMNTDDQYRMDIIKALLYAMILKMTSIYNNSKIVEAISSSHKGELLKQLQKFIFEYHRKERRVSFYAEKMCLTPKYLSRVIKDVSGRTIHEWIDEAVIRGAKVFLKSTELTVAQISEELNFPNASFFGKYFKKHTGMTPIVYKKSK